MDFPNVPVDLALLEPIDVLAARTFDELRRKETQAEDDGVVEPKNVLTDNGVWSVGIWIGIGIAVFALIALLMRYRKST